MKIYTKKGDHGLTSLIGGTKVSKSHPRLECYGTIDELNSCIGCLAAMNIPDQAARTTLMQIQECLFIIGSNLAMDPLEDTMRLPQLSGGEAVLLEGEIDRMSALLPELKSFILPGGSQAGAWCHVARSVCRRSERLIVALSQAEKVDAHVLIYLNRLSDYLFVLARKINSDLGAAEIIWKPKPS